jgi:uncharacterized membrane protein
MMRTLSRYFLTGLLVLVPTWATFLILSALLTALNRAISDFLGQVGVIATPFIGILLFVLVVLAGGAFGTHLLGSRMIAALERWITQIPLVRSIYLTIKGMTDLFQFRSRFGRSTVIAFPFPRDGVWALGFIMGSAPKAAQIDPASMLLMVFVPTAIHPFTGYLAFVPESHVRRLNLLPEDAMKMEFSAGFYKPADGWLRAPRTTT